MAHSCKLITLFRQDCFTGSGMNPKGFSLIYFETKPQQNITKHKRCAECLGSYGQVHGRIFGIRYKKNVFCEMTAILSRFQCLNLT